MSVRSASGLSGQVSTFRSRFPLRHRGSCPLLSKKKHFLRHANFRTGYQKILKVFRPLIFHSLPAPPILLHRTKCPGSTSRYSGSAASHCLSAWLQRVQNLQPTGRFAGSGIRPGIGFNRSTSSSSDGMDPNNPFVYGCRGLSKICSMLPYSTSWPA